jgi:hypothetical protein
MDDISHQEEQLLSQLGVISSRGVKMELLRMTAARWLIPVSWPPPMAE